MTGSALYVASYYGEGGGSTESISDNLAFVQESSTGVYAAMDDAFGADPASPEGALLRLSDLPTRERTGPWSVATDDTTTWACAPDGFGDLDVAGSTAARYSAVPAQSDGEPIGRVRSAVLEFSDIELAGAEFQKLLTVLDDCEADQGLAFAGSGETDGIDANQAAWSTYTYAAPEICTDCDAVWFDRMGAVQVGSKIALVSYAEVGGPLQPNGLDKVMTDLLDAAAARL